MKTCPYGEPGSRRTRAVPARGFVPEVPECNGAPPESAVSVVSDKISLSGQARAGWG